MIIFAAINFDTVLWKSLALPVVAAIITTLLIEMFAKPKLEARKARIIRDRQQYDKIIFSFQKASMSIASLDVKKKSPLIKRYTQIMLEEARKALYDLLQNISLLPSKYVTNHNEHIGKTVRFIGYLLAKIELAEQGIERDVEYVKLIDIKKLAAHLELFDIYYLVYVYMYDSQESWWRRLWWQISKESKNNQKIDKLFDELNLGEKHAK